MGLGYTALSRVLTMMELCSSWDSCIALLWLQMFATSQAPSLGGNLERLQPLRQA